MKVEVEIPSGEYCKDCLFRKGHYSWVCEYLQEHLATWNSANPGNTYYYKHPKCPTSERLNNRRG